MPADAAPLRLVEPSLERLPYYAAALAAAKRAAGEQKVPGETVGIEYETADGIWHEELDPGSDRPETAVEDDD